YRPWRKPPLLSEVHRRDRFLFYQARLYYVPHLQSGAHCNGCRAPGFYKAALYPRPWSKWILLPQKEFLWLILVFSQGPEGHYDEMKIYLQSSISPLHACRHEQAHQEESYPPFGEL